MSIVSVSSTTAEGLRPVGTEARLIAAAEALGPVLKARAAAVERNGSLPDETVADLFRVGLMRYFVPHRYGGDELEWGTQIQVGRRLAHACGSTAWIGCVVGSHPAYVARMDPRAQDDVWSDGPDVVVATASVMRDINLQEAKGGWRLSGRWSFSSGIDHAGWALLRAVRGGDNRQSYFLIPRADITVENDWRVSGMSGTGSKSLVVKDAFIPSYRVLSMAELMAPNPPGAAVNQGPVHSASFRLFAGSALMGPILGCAEAILAEYRALAEQGAAGLDINDPQCQLRIAEAAAETSSAVRLTEALIERQMKHARSGEPMTKSHRIANVLERTYAARLCGASGTRLMNSLDAASVFNDAPIQRHYRDLLAMMQQIGVNWDRNMIAAARAMFNMKTDIPDLNSD